MSKRSNISSLKLVRAINSGNLQGVREVLRNQVIDLENLPYSEYTYFRKKDTRALALALMCGADNRMELVKELLQNGADIQSQGDYGETYIGFIVQDKCKEEVHLWLEEGADPSAKDDKGYSAMEYLAEELRTDEEDWKIVELLIDYGGKITEKTLKIYVKNEEFYFGKRMIEYIREHGGKTGLKLDLEYAVCGENDKILEFLDHNKVSDKRAVIKYASANCNVQVLQKLRTQGCKLNIMDKRGMNLLQIAAQYNEDEKVLEYLLESGLSTGKDEEECNALTLATIGGKAGNVRILRKWGVKWQVGNRFELNSWKQVCKYGMKNSIQILLDNGWNPTTEEIVAGYGSVVNKESLMGLLKCKIPYNVSFIEEEEYDEATTITGFSELCISEPQLAFELYKQQGDVELTDQVLKNISYSTEFLKYLLEQKVNLPKKVLIYALAYVVQNGDFEMVKYLIKKGADPNGLCGKDSYTVMHIAAEEPSEDILNYLIEKGGDMKMKNYDGYTAENLLEQSNIEFKKWLSESEEI